MEDNPKKLNLMMKCYLGQWHPIYGDEIRVNDFGMGNALTGILGYAECIVRGVKSEESARRLKKIYHLIASEYNRIPIEKLDETDGDFRVVLATHSLLPNLKSSIENLVENPTDSHLEEIKKL